MENQKSNLEGAELMEADNLLDYVKDIIYGRAEEVVRQKYFDTITEEQETSLVDAMYEEMRKYVKSNL